MLRGMRFAPLAIAAILVPALAVAPGCKPREPEQPPPPPPAKSASIWTARESQDIAGKLAEAAQRETWASQFRDRNGRAARLAVGDIADRSGREVPVGAFADAIADAIAATGGDKLAIAAAGEADFRLGGVITASSGALPDGAAAVYFAVDLQVVPAAGGDVVWPFAIEQPVVAP